MNRAARPQSGEGSVRCDRRGVRTTVPVKETGRVAVLPHPLATAWFEDVVTEVRPTAADEAGSEAIGFFFQHLFESNTIEFHPLFEGWTEVDLLDVE